MIMLKQSETRWRRAVIGYLRELCKILFGIKQKKTVKIKWVHNLNLTVSQL